LRRTVELVAAIKRSAMGILPALCGPPGAQRRSDRFALLA
jgi:hypothetical protein